MGAIVNAVAIIVCSLIGLQIRSGIPERVQKSLMQAVGLCVLSIGIAGAIQGNNTIVMILSIVLGTLIGEWVDIDRRVLSGINKVEKKISKGSAKYGDLSHGMVSAAMIFCIGSMAIVGSLESGLIGDNTTLYTKSILDGITSILLSIIFRYWCCLSINSCSIDSRKYYYFCWLTRALATRGCHHRDYLCRFCIISWLRLEYD